MYFNVVRINIFINTYVYVNTCVNVLYVIKKVDMYNLDYNCYN